ncbi:MAG: cyclic peptide export ABC transporter [Cellvibrionaceae bacterium]|nr:cyclic peptide export ABC transporter [Cellvibrionaceae bacterium]
MLAHLIRQSRHLLLAASAASVIAGVCGVLLVSLINTALSLDNHTSTLAWRFTGVIIVVMVCRTLAAVLFERLGQHALAELRRYISSRVLATDFRRLEILGGPKVHSALSEHSTNVSQFFVSLPAILTNGVVVIGCMIYMAILSWQIFIAAVVMIGLGSLGYHFAHLQAIRHLGNAAKEQDRLFSHFRSLTDGAKELRLHAQKRQSFKEEVLGASIDQVRQSRALGMSIFVASASWGNFLIYAFIGVVLFVLVGDVPDRIKITTGFALIFLYMVVPLEVLLLNIPRANLARSAAERINEITQDMPSAVATEGVSRNPIRFESVQLRKVTHRYYHEQSDELFELGPIDLEFLPGSITFLVGGNGSGKTTLAKLLVGLYAPERGEIQLNGESITEDSRDHYRQLFSAIFSDFHLFERLLEPGRADLDEEGNRLLKRLHLQHKVKVRHGAFSTQTLSQGQRKRLALVAACLEDRPFLVFDEWAADQDPVFKEVFYHELLPELKAQGKTLLVISHDDRYFHLGDRLIKLENGRLTKIQTKQCPVHRETMSLQNSNVDPA